MSSEKGDDSFGWIMDACRRTVTVLIVLLWTIGGLPATRGRSTGDHTDDSSSVRVFVHRRCEAMLTPSDAGPQDDGVSWSVGPERVTVFVALAPVPPASAMDRPMVHTNIVHWGNPRGPPMLG